MKNNNLIKRIVCTVLCVCMAAGAVISFNSCMGGDTDEGALITAVRLIRDVNAGERITILDMEEINVLDTDVPEGTVNLTTDAINKYAVTNLCAGDYVTTKNSQEDMPSANTAEYIDVTKYVKLDNDVSDDLQKLIDENPNRTFYFPDGTYNFEKSVLTPADPNKSVSFYCSNYAMFVATDRWQGGVSDAIIRFGAGPDGGTEEEKAAGSCFITGGIFVANGKTAISVEGGRNTLIHNFSIKKSEVGIHIKADYVVVDNGVINGTYQADTSNSDHKYHTDTSIGVLVEGSYNTVQTMRICYVHGGIKVTKENNIFRNLHPLYVANNYESYGFYDASKGNFFDMCYSDQFAIGFLVEEHTRSIFNGCFALWYSDAPGKDRHWGFASNGSFNSIVRTTRIDLKVGAVDCAYLHEADGKEGKGTGKIVYPIILGKGGEDHKDYEKYLYGTTLS